MERSSQEAVELSVEPAPTIVLEEAGEEAGEAEPQAAEPQSWTRWISGLSGGRLARGWESWVTESVDRLLESQAGKRWVPIERLLEQHLAAGGWVARGELDRVAERLDALEQRLQAMADRLDAKPRRAAPKKSTRRPATAKAGSKKSAAAEKA